MIAQTEGGVGTYPEMGPLESWHLAMEFADRMQIGHKIIIIAQRADALIQSRHHSGGMLAQLHRLVQIFALQMLEPIEEIKQILVLFEQTLCRAR